MVLQPLQREEGYEESNDGFRVRIFGDYWFGYINGIMEIGFGKISDVENRILWDKKHELFQVIYKNCSPEIDSVNWRGIAAYRQEVLGRNLRIEQEKRGVDLQVAPYLNFILSKKTRKNSVFVGISPSCLWMDGMSLFYTKI